MDELAIATGYFEAWARRDPNGIAASFAAEGTFWDPDGERPAAAVGAHARRLFERFPGLTFETRGVGPSGDGGVVGRWTIRVGEQVARGADFLTVVGDRVAAVERYYDRAALRTADPAVEVGSFVRVGSGRRSVPSAFGITWQEVAAETGRETVRGISERIVRDLPAMPGFVGGLIGTVGDRFLTVTAWEDENAPFELIRSGSHRMAAVQFFGPELYQAGWTGVWTPARLNNRWVRCAGCGKMVVARDGGTCGCGAALPEAPAYW